jgi:hypothetical protein
MPKKVLSAEQIRQEVCKRILLIRWEYRSRCQRLIWSTIWRVTGTWRNKAMLATARIFVAWSRRREKSSFYPMPPIATRSWVTRSRTVRSRFLGAGSVRQTHSLKVILSKQSIDVRRAASRIKEKNLCYLA